MRHDNPPTNLEELLDRLDEAAEEEDDVTLDTVMDEVGRRSFGPLLLLTGLLMMPLSSDTYRPPPSDLGCIHLSDRLSVADRQRPFLAAQLVAESIAGGGESGECIEQQVTTAFRAIYRPASQEAVGNVHRLRRSESSRRCTDPCGASDSGVRVCSVQCLPRI